MRRARAQGFTLIELSIVLLIVGLLAGGILIGRDLIRIAELRADISALDKFDQAEGTFLSKYNCLPGDCEHATQFFEGAYNGNGNGLIDTFLMGPNQVEANYGAFLSYEVAYAIDHLARADLIAMEPFDANAGTRNGHAVTSDLLTPTLPSGGHFMVRTECIAVGGGGNCVNTGKHNYRLGVSDNGNGTLSTAIPIYTATDGFYIDSKLDDGQAISGRVVAAGANVIGDHSIAFLPVSLLYSNGVCDNSGDSGSMPADVGLDPSTCQYDFTVKDKKVGLFVRASF